MTTPEFRLAWFRLGTRKRAATRQDSAARPGARSGTDGAAPAVANAGGPDAVPSTGTRRGSWLRGFPVELCIVVLAALDVWLAMDDEIALGWNIQALAQDDPSLPHSIVLSAISCLALFARRRFPFITLLITVPGFFVGWAQLAAMVALWTLARRKQLAWQTIVGALLVAACRFVTWPPELFFEDSWRSHALDAIWSAIVAGLPVALGLLAAAREELAARYTELTQSRERERQLHAIAVREQERTRLARDMHDGVSHQVTLIAMQAGALKVAADDESTAQSADTIRQLSLRTLGELREMVGLLRSSATQQAGDGCQHDLSGLARLINESEVDAALLASELPEQLPAEVSSAAYRTVQEALTNVCKHAPGAAATVRVYHSDDQLHVHVRNTAASEAPSANLPSGGYGLAGLAERAEQLGGSFAAATLTSGGFELHASYPLGPNPSEPSSPADLAVRESTDAGAGTTTEPLSTAAAD
ncbi:signal transduction histidine kinase [Tamaricihabitans halophyticus]|uniref:histidine kinase n=1 Tax=Tamaricihabitans halophyticus TaxID=1262583 RepID=A0A4R2QB87_9PSEU|nr:histidine kinase [Tamaricihabitans halophyticus]TCP46230.1 signal transduction histidine kinase [Tamaricihabitans halophyticus]